MGVRTLVILIILPLAVIIAQISNIITVNHDNKDIKNVAEMSGVLNDDDDNIFVFVQVSDLHISFVEEPQRFEDLKEFCNINMKAIKPRVIVASGDLTDAIAPDRMAARQFEVEWKMYNEILTLCQTVTGVDWLDLRGNHDNFNVDGYNSSSNYYKIFGAQRYNSPGSYMTTIKASDNTKYAFIGVDATLDLGPKRILNFGIIGDLDDNKMAQLERHQWVATESKVNATIWFGHYPTSSIYSTSPGFRQVASNGITYLCGHYHTFFNTVPHMYAKQHSGLLELELADWKKNRAYRVAVLDHGLFSFVDVELKQWPVILVTNPKPAITIQPSKEPYNLVATSTHIRILIFSPSPIELCEARIGNGEWIQCHLSSDKNPLYTLPWQPKLYTSGLHFLEVRSRDQQGSSNQVKIEFSLDGSHPVFPVLARIALMMDLTSSLKVLFGLATAFCIIPLCVFRVIQHQVLNRKMVMHRFKNRLFRNLIKKYWIVASVNCLCFPIVFYSLYLTVGPWFAGDVIDGRPGVVFAWGTIFAGKILPGTMSYFYGFSHVLTFNGPLLYATTHTSDYSFSSAFDKSYVKNSKATKVWKHLPFVLFFVVHLMGSIPFWFSYGSMATLLCPMRTWAIIMAGYLWYKASTLGVEDLKNASKIWT